MDGLQVSVEGIGTAALEAYLCSGRAPPRCMSLSELDGFLTGIAAGPDRILPSEWMPIAWGGESPRFSGDTEASGVLGGLLSRYNAIVRGIDAGVVEPVFPAEADGRHRVADWVRGFGLAVALRPERWQRLVRSPQSGILLLPILLASGQDLSLGLDAEDEAGVLAAAPALLPLTVLGIARYWKRHRPHREGIILDSVNGVAQVARRPGRNDPCPCGSGRKHKKCCGGAHAAA